MTTTLTASSEAQLDADITEVNEAGTGNFTIDLTGDITINSTGITAFHPRAGCVTDYRRRRLHT